MRKDIKKIRIEMRYHNIKKSELKMIGGLKTLVIEWDDGEKDEIWGSCLDNLRNTLQNRV